MNTSVTLRRLCGLALVMAGAAAHLGSAHAVDVRVARQYGVAYIPLMIMQDRKLIEKHAAQLGVKDVNVVWQQFTGGAVMNDALLSGNLDFAVVGPPPFLTMWARTQGTQNQVVGIASLNTMPMFLMTRSPAIKSVKDFTPADRIVVSGVKVSTQAVVLQMAAAQAWGIKSFDQLDKLTVAMPLSDSMAMMLSGKSEITGDFTVPPFSYREKKAGMTSVIDTFSVLGGPSSTNVIYTTKKYHDANSKLTQAFAAALREAQSSIAENKAAAASVYLRLSGDRETQENIVEILSDPQISFDSTPRGIMSFAKFMHETGSIKVQPESWKTLFVPELHEAAGN
ncbi:NLPA lipoprotein [Burkholderiales bacterium 8X]|nr:NLPA lipoprotein [Burkholderiales bacterium 8X]